MNRGQADNRSGALLLELVVSGLVLGIVLSTAIPMLGWVARERKLNQQREAAILEAGNLMEEIALMPWDELSSERLSQRSLSPGLLKHIPDAQLTAKVDLDPAEPRMKRVHLELRWETAPGKAAPPVKLTGWFANREKGASHAEP